MEEQKLEIINWEDGNDYIQRIDHVLQRSVITELLMGFLPLEEWGKAFMLTVEDPSKRSINKSQPGTPTGEVVTAAVVAFLANVRVLLFDGPPGTTAPIVDYLLANNVRFPQNSVAGPARVVNEFCQLWADRTGFKYTPQREQRVYGVQEMPRFPKKLKKPPGKLRKATPQDSGTIALMYTSFLDEMYDRVPGGYKGAGDEDNAPRRGKQGGDVFVVNSCINEGKVYLLEDSSLAAKTRQNNYGIVAMLFLGDVKQDASAEISMIYTVPQKRRQGFSSLLVVEASKKLLSEGIFFVFALEDSKVDTLNYRFLVKLGFRLEEFQTVGSLVDEGAGAVNEGSSETYAYSEPNAPYSEGGGDGVISGDGDGDGGIGGNGGIGDDGGIGGDGDGYGEAEAEWDGSSYDTSTTAEAAAINYDEGNGPAEQQQPTMRRRGEAATLPRTSAPWIEEPHAVGDGDATSSFVSTPDAASAASSELGRSRPRSVLPPPRSDRPAPAAGPLYASDTGRVVPTSATSQLPARPIARSQPDRPQPPPRRPTPPSPTAVSPLQDEPHSPRTQDTELSQAAGAPQATAGGRPVLPPKPKPAPPPKPHAGGESERGTRPRYALDRAAGPYGAVLPPPRPRLYYTQNTAVEQKDRFTNILCQSQRRASTRAPTLQPRLPSPAAQSPPPSSSLAVAPPISPRSQPAVMARFGGVEPVLPCHGPPPTLRRPEQPAAVATEGAPVPALQHMTKERPRPPVRRLPKRPDSEMRQERMKKAVKVDVCSQTSTSTLEARLTMIPTAAPTDKSKISFEITSTQTNQTKFKNYTVYSLLVRRGDETHTVVHRYSEFLELHKSITKRVSPSLIPFFPGKKLFNNLSTDVVELRRTKLLAYMNNLVAMPEVMALCSEKIEAFIKPNATTG